MIMSARVSPNECTARLNNGMSDSISEQQAKMNGVSNMTGSPPEAKIENKHLFKAVNEIYSPVLKLMKLFGIYYGDTTLKSLANDSGRFSRKEYDSLMYCGLVATGVWYNFFLAVLSCFFVPEKIYVSLMFSIWCLMGALNETILLIVSPVTRAKKSRFQNFLRGLIEHKSHATLDKIHSFQKILRTVPVSKEDEGKLVMFMLDLQGDPQGLSIGGLVVITKSLSLTIAGVIVSYFAVMLSLPK
ncbi:uncharacterized protein LOC111325762 isoform X2 [Stylophora pistillata]|uniref:uncharacterized protein LOC111325762 isoform X2 n=1 Tax=Stylophora pistillata TaxID=50429 RepID=UPI000C05375C|nr:uncharacterized protein LOC111325762 isoform X2 [Stylophora pistillata]